MKFNPIMTILSLALGALVAYALFSYCRTEELRWVIAVTGGISTFLTWAGTMAVALEDKARNVNFKVFNGICAVAVIAMQFVFALKTGLSQPTYLLTSGVVLLIWLMIAYVLGKNK